jgi:hypothetical protein
VTRALAVRLVAAWMFGVHRRLNVLYYKHGREVLAVEAMNRQLADANQSLIVEITQAEAFIVRHQLGDQYLREVAEAQEARSAGAAR